ncbi:MAG: 5'-methylthioadenosine/adenosylhomocysteine nucleosidase [Lachnospiraceae bacterium]|nr:5'-methylthioadenosine/adenosylhomocysteine nucleosidase [Lachnospiraceae bacterium]
MQKIGIIGAMEIEVERLKADMTVRREITKARMVFCEGELSGMPVVVVRSGIGKVNAAVCAQILTDEFGADCIMNTGVAGSLDARIDIGDIVISKDVLHHDMDAVNFGYPLGQIPQMEVFSFEADAALASLAEEVCREVNPDIAVYHGRIASGDQFIADKAAKERIISCFGGSCTEMEGAAIAQTSYLNGIPFVILRAISDKADDSASMDYPAFEREAAQHCVRLVEGLLARLAKKQ